MADKNRIEVHPSRLWALFHGNFTRVILPERMILDDKGVSLKRRRSLFKFYDKTLENVDFPNMADEKLHTRLLLATIQVDNTSGKDLDTLVLEHVWKWPATRFVEEARNRKSRSKSKS